MKKLFTLFLIIGIASCSSPEKKAQELIKECLKKNLNDAKSYESISFGKLDSLYSNVYDDTTYMAISSLYEDAFNHFEKYIDSASVYSKLIFNNDNIDSRMEFWENKIKDNRSKLNQYRSTLDSIKRTFIPVHNGWIMRHKYRANNSFGLPEINENAFCLNLKITEVILENELDYFLELYKKNTK